MGKIMRSSFKHNSICYKCSIARLILMCNTTVVIISVAKIVSYFHGIGFKSKKGGLPKLFRSCFAKHMTLLIVH